MNGNHISQSNDSPADYVCVAAVMGAFGVRGEIRLKSFTQNPMDCVNYGPLLDERGNVVLTPVSLRRVKKSLALKTEEISSREAAERLKSTKLYIPRQALPEPDKDEFYYTDLMGLEVLTEQGNRMGRVKAVHNFGAGDVLEIQMTGEPSWFLPFTQAAVPHINIDAGYLHIAEPDETDADPNITVSENEKQKEEDQDGIDALYSGDILKLAASLRNERLTEPDGSARKVAKLCGSSLEIDVMIADQKVSDVALRVKACALGQASAAILRDHIIGAKIDDLVYARDALQALLKSDGPPPNGRFKALSLLSTVRDYPVRHGSVLLPFHAAISAVEQAMSGMEDMGVKNSGHKAP